MCQMTGWLALDGNRHTAARRYLTTAVYAAHEAEQPVLATSSLAYLSVRDRVHYLVRMARCYLLQRKVDRAREVATESVALSEAIGSARVVERLGEFHVALDPFATSKSAQEFRELYVGVMTQRSSVN
jgi:hypothetical protein